MIYFDKSTQSSLVNRFYEKPGKGGILFIGHAESLTGIQHPFRYVKPLFIRRKNENYRRHGGHAGNE